MGKARDTTVSAQGPICTTSAYIYGAICPAEGKGAALILPRCNTEGMTLRLAEISTAVAPGARAILILDYCCFSWNRLMDQPWRIMSIGLRQ